MNLTTDTVAITGASALRRLADFFELTKPRIVLMVLVTAFVGFYVGSEKIPDYLRLLQLLLGTALAAGGTLALNQFLERDTDAMPAGEIIDGTGHHHIFINQDFTPAGQVIPTDDTHRHFGKGQTEAVLDLPPGNYKLTLQFADGLHRSYGKELSATINVKVASK